MVLLSSLLKSCNGFRTTCDMWSGYRWVKSIPASDCTWFFWMEAPKRQNSHRRTVWWRGESCHTFVNILLSVLHVDTSLVQAGCTGQLLVISRPYMSSSFYITMVKWVSRDQLTVRWVNRAQNMSTLSLCDVTTGDCKTVRNLPLNV